MTSNTVKLLKRKKLINSTFLFEKAGLRPNTVFVKADRGTLSEEEVQQINDALIEMICEIVKTAKLDVNEVIKALG